MIWIRQLNSQILWGIPMVVLMLGTGLFLTVQTRALLFRRFPALFRCTLGTLFQRKQKSARSPGAISPFQALCTALAGTVGTGNIVGVALAIAAGGPGAVFWLWISALGGMVIKYSEVTLAVAYRTGSSGGELVGGPMYYISRGLKLPWLATVFALLGAVAAFGIGAMVQSNSMATSLEAAFRLPGWIAGAAAAALAGLVVIGGIRRIAAVAGVFVPFMALFYLAGSAIVLAVNASAIPEAFAMIFRDAFTGTAATGGVLGATARIACRMGLSRGVFTHEAGMGSAPIAHACADTDHPARQGLWGAMEVFIDSILLCTVTALVILTSGMWKQEGKISATLCQAAFGAAFPGGEYVVTIGLTLFAFATIISWYYYGETCARYLLPKAENLLLAYRVAYISLVFAGGVLAPGAVWELADLFNGLMALPNLMALIALSPVVCRLTQEFFLAPRINKL